MKIRTRVGFWNIRTMSTSGTLNIIEREMENYRIDILGLSETRWNTFGEILTQNGNSFIYSGNRDENAPKQAGVGILMSIKAKRALQDWRPISERILIARFKKKVRYVSIVQCYAPTEEASEEDKTNFYDQLEESFRSIKKQDIKIVMGDLNAKVGSNNCGLE